MSNYGVIASIGTQEIIICKMEDMDAKQEELGEDPECFFDYFRELNIHQVENFVSIYTARYPHYKLINLNGVDEHVGSTAQSNQDASRAG